DPGRLISWIGRLELREREVALEDAAEEPVSVPGDGIARHSEVDQPDVRDAREGLHVLPRIADHDAVDLEPRVRLELAVSPAYSDTQAARRDAPAPQHVLDRHGPHQAVRPEDAVAGRPRHRPGDRLHHTPLRAAQPGSGRVGAVP